MQKQRCVWCFNSLEKTVIEHFLFKEGFCLECKQKLQSGFYHRQIKGLTHYYQYPDNEETDALYRYLKNYGDRYLLQKLLHPYYLFYFAHWIFIPMPVEKSTMLSFGVNPNAFLIKNRGVCRWLDILSFESSSTKTLRIFEKNKIKDKSVLLFSLSLKNQDVFWNVYNLLEPFTSKIAILTVFEKIK